MQNRRQTQQTVFCFYTFSIVWIDNILKFVFCKTNTKNVCPELCVLICCLQVFIVFEHWNSIRASTHLVKRHLGKTTFPHVAQIELTIINTSKSQSIRRNSGDHQHSNVRSCRVGVGAPAFTVGTLGSIYCWLFNFFTMRTRTKIVKCLVLNSCQS